MPDINLSLNDDGGKLKISLGDRLIINLEQLGGAGYEWEKDVFDSSFFQETSPQDATVKKGAFGESGARTFIFQPLKKGTAEIRLKHRRPWDPDASTINEFAISIQIT